MLMQHIHTINFNKILPLLYQNGLIILYMPRYMYATYFKDKFVSFNPRWSYLPYTLGLGRSHSDAGFIFLTVMRVDLGVLGAVGGAAS